MKSRQKRIIVLNDLKSPNFEQAFFVLRDGRDSGRNAVFEAERIVEEYIFPSSPPSKPRRERDWDYLPFAVTAAVAVLAGFAAVLVNLL